MLERASLELAPPVGHEIFNVRLPRVSTPPFFQKAHSLEK